MNEVQLQYIGAGAFGAVIGWYLYYINRHRKSEVQLGDLVTVLAMIGGAAVTALFPTQTALFGAYGIGLAAGFFTYFILLILMVWSSKNFEVDWFIDGRRRKLDENHYIPEAGTDTAGRAMGSGGKPLDVG